jgi:hypothetical protein
MKPEDIIISIILENNHVVIMHMITKEFGERGVVNWEKKGTKEEIEKEINRAKCMWDSPVKSWRIVKENEVPIDRTYRNAWKDTGKKIEHDMEKVKTIHMERQRYARIPLLDELDKKWMRATGQGKKDEADKIEIERQKLRDLPATILPELEKAKTPEEVRGVGLI